VNSPEPGLIVAEYKGHRLVLDCRDPLNPYREESFLGTEMEIKKNRSVSVSYPNPFNPECYIPVSAKGKVKNVKCKIYNILGQLVREIEISNLKPQISKSIYWDERDSRGLEVPPGVYFYEVAGETVRRMVVLR
jgi:flagellar hook assembly protein FlgD